MSSDAERAILAAIPRLRANDPTLTELGPFQGTVSVAVVQQLAEALKTNSALTSLNLLYNNIGVESTRRVLEVLEENAALRRQRARANAALIRTWVRARRPVPKSSLSHRCLVSSCRTSSRVCRAATRRRHSMRGATRSVRGGRVVRHHVTMVVVTRRG